MKHELDMTGDVLTVKASHEVNVDSDQDGVSSVSGTVAIELKLDGSEVADELLKSSSMVQVLTEKLKNLGIKI